MGDLFVKRYIKRIEIMFIFNSKQSEYIQCASSKDLLDTLVRVKSSNIYSYGMDVDNIEDNVSDVVVQFKGKNGQPDDIYMYFDVPIIVFRRWVSAPSKGIYFWRYIRNNYKYRKLTGDKRTKLPNGIN